MLQTIKLKIVVKKEERKQIKKVNMRKQHFICFIDLSKAFDKVSRQKLLQVLKDKN